MININMESIVKQIPLNFSEFPEGFGWAPDRHFRARVTVGGIEKKVILKRCWSFHTYNVERYVYKTLAHQLSLKTPQLLDCRVLEGEYWLVLEDIGSYCADSENPFHRIGLLKMLGCLHGKGLNLLSECLGNDCVLSHFDSCGEEYISKKDLIEQAMLDDRFNLSDWVTPFYEYMWSEIRQQEKTVVHGDTDFSNVIVDSEELGLIDFEKCKIGPSIIDFSKIAEYIKNNDEYKAYMEAFNHESGRKMPLDQILHTAYLGKVYDSFHWICYDIRNTFTPSYPDYKFDKYAFSQKVEKLAALHKRMMVVI